ncbi:hypothetical protein [Luteimonas sp. FCS-9]|uniref:hypothetical protein n=1 Tax=Luteimonas sp. FCS-9 TaxID=1547516 RepID=UPI00063E9E70|nr:hypothetical protein [Luteimonas sp. FCS-9]KLI97860.1 hypothetical protein WQ56_16320 [Luteimonas sp. FCS-9]
MPDTLTPTDTIITGAVRFRDLAYVATQDDSLEARIEHSHLYSWDDGAWGHDDMKDWPTASITITQQPLQQVLFMSPYGDVRLFGSGQENDERICTPEDDPRDRGHLRQVRTIGQHTFAVGMGRQVYRREGVGHWSCLDQAIRPAIGETKGFESIDGFNAGDLYAVGWDGEIWRYDGTHWHPQASPTPQVLTRVLCAGDGQVYASGRRGLLIVGRHDRWRVLAQNATVGDIQDLAWYASSLYVATARGLYTLQADTLVPVAFGEHAPATFHHLSAADGVLWAFGAKDILAFDGTAWSRID